MGWRLQVPTPCEILQSLLFFSNVEEDFEELISDCTDNMILCAILYEACRFSPSSIALGSLLALLEKRQYDDFALDLRNLILQRGLPFNLAEAEECRALLIANSDLSDPEAEPLNKGDEDSLLVYEEL
jgi:hypothetical protein